MTLDALSRRASASGCRAVPPSAVRRSLRLLALAGIAAALAGCSKNPSSPATGTIDVRMTDAPASYDAVNLVVREVAIHGADAGGDSTAGWIPLRSDSVTYDLLALRNGVFSTIGTSRVPAGRYTQLRLKLGAGSNVVVGGVAHPIDVPSGLQSGFKLVGSFDVPANGLLDLALDFDAARSIVLNGTGGYTLKPTVRVMPFSTAGAIRGGVSPAGTETAVVALEGADTLGTASAAPDGNFEVSVLPAGTYSLSLHPASGFRDTTLSGVAVGSGSTTDVGSVSLTPQ